MCLFRDLLTRSLEHFSYLLLNHRRLSPLVPSFDYFSQRRGTILQQLCLSHSVPVINIECRDKEVNSFVVLVLADELIEFKQQRRARVVNVRPGEADVEDVFGRLNCLLNILFHFCVQMDFKLVLGDSV